mmetsp:Transcript_43305/g.104675  ORF Transcript_43305/g.104675 Transcript_43305/m.104675 type:complete len:275 (+) Transcript_43305:348-1172(+)
MPTEKISPVAPKDGVIDSDEESQQWSDIDKDVARVIDEFNQRYRFSSEAGLSRSSLMTNVRRSSGVAFEAINKKKDYLKEAISKLMGDDYSTHEAAFVLFVGALISFNTGYVNGSCLSGLISPNNTKTSVTGLTTKYSTSALHLANSEFQDASIQFSLIGSYFLGAFLSGLVTPKATPYRIEPTYGPTFLIGGIFLTAASILSAKGVGDTYIFCFAAAAAGIQNGIASIFSANLIRCSLTGSTTDIAITLGQVIRGNRKQLRKSMVLLMIVSCF